MQENVHVCTCIKVEKIDFTCNWSTKSYAADATAARPSRGWRRAATAVHLWDSTPLFSLLSNASCSVNVSNITRERAGAISLFVIRLSLIPFWFRSYRVLFAISIVLSSAKHVFSKFTFKCVKEWWLIGETNGYCRSHRSLSMSWRK